MNFIWEKITEWLKNLLVGGIISNLTGMFDSINDQVADVAAVVGATPQGWNASVFNMVKSLSENVIIPIAGLILTFVMTYELIQMIIERNNMAEFETFNFFKWIMKTFCAVMIVTNTYTWQNGRQLQKMQKSGETVEYVYNENGLRVQKTAITTGVTKYTLHGKNIVHMTQGSNELHFFYDAQNKPAVVVYNGTPYSYVKNLQGDIVAILDSNKNVVVSYVYDAWGRPISKTGTLASTLGTVQPFRYRGYVYDEETGLYYLESRYYQSAICRFLNSDTVIYEICTIGTHNVFAYCGNAPVFRCDNSGTAWWHWALAVGVVALCAVAVVATAGSVVSAAATVVAVANGVTTAPAAATIAATAFVGSATALYATATCAALDSDSIEEFMDKGDGGTIAITAFGGAVAAADCTYQYYRQLKARHFRITQIGMIESPNHQGNPQPAIRFDMDKANGRPAKYSFEFHYNHAHKGYQPHFQLNKVNPRDGSTSSDKYWTWWGMPIVGPRN